MSQTETALSGQKRHGLRAYKWKALATVAMGTIMATMDMSIVNLSFPTLTRVFGADLDTVMWTTLAYILVSVSTILIVGRIGDMVGRKRVYTLGIFVFTLGVVACSLSQSIGQLIFFRSLQAVGAAMTISCGTAIVTEAFPSEELGRGLGLMGVAVSAGFISGPVIGGLLLDWIDWRAIFYMRAPVGLVTVIMAHVLLQEEKRGDSRIRLDLRGAILSSVGLFSLIFGLSQLKRMGTDSPAVWLMVGTGLILLVLFVVLERRAEDPIVDLSLFENRVFCGATGSLFFLFVSAPAFILIMPFYLIEGMEFSPSTAGLFLTVNSAATMLTGPISGWLSDRYGPVWFSSLGAGLTAAGFCFMLGFDLQTPVTTIIGVLLILGMGIGTFQAPNNSTLMGSVDRKRLGSASALIATVRQVGLSLGMALVGTMFTARRAAHQIQFSNQGMEAGQAGRFSIPPAFHDVLLISVILGFLAVLFSLASGKGKGGDE
ncbi:MAG: MFS transporter [Deltaproteobacteria bacterium]|nr:MFS transporter [Deltaproteobacteria bacterium]